MDWGKRFLRIKTYQNLLLEHRGITSYIPPPILRPWKPLPQTIHSVNHCLARRMVLEPQDFFRLGPALNRRGSWWRRRVPLWNIRNRGCVQDVVCTLSPMSAHYHNLTNRGEGRERERTKLLIRKRPFGHNEPLPTSLLHLQRADVRLTHVTHVDEIERTGGYDVWV